METKTTKHRKMSHAKREALACLSIAEGFIPRYSGPIRQRILFRLTFKELRRLIRAIPD